MRAPGIRARLSTRRGLEYYASPRPGVGFPQIEAAMDAELGSGDRARRRRRRARTGQDPAALPTRSTRRTANRRSRAGTAWRSPPAPRWRMSSNWPDRIREVSASAVQRSGAHLARQESFGDRLPDQGRKKARGEAFVKIIPRCSLQLRRLARDRADRDHAGAADAVGAGHQCRARAQPGRHRGLARARGIPSAPHHGIRLPRRRQPGPRRPKPASPIWWRSFSTKAPAISTPRHSTNVWRSARSS